MPIRYYNSTKLKHLPEELQKRAIERANEQQNKNNDFEEITQESDLAGMFIYSETEEGHKFWAEVEDKYYPEEEE